jgi:adenylate kinase family enzyme
MHNDFEMIFENPISKINVIGTSGSGKSTLSKKIAEALQFPYIELDRLFWKANWQGSSDEEFFANVKLALDKPQWVLDGNYSRTVPIKWKEVDIVVWLDYPFTQVLLQAIRRAVTRAWNQEEIWEGTGNRESFKKSFFSKESIIWWTIATHTRVKKNYEQILSDSKFSDIKFVRLRSHAQADKFIEAIRQARI